MQKAVNRSVGDLYGRTNLLLSQFGLCSALLRYKLFETYCTSVYGAELQNYYDGSTEKLYTAWRKCVRRVVGLSPRTRCGLLPYIVHGTPIELRLHRRFLNFIYHSCNNNNAILRAVSLRALYDVSASVSARNMAHLCHFYHIIKYKVADNPYRPSARFIINQELKEVGNLISNFIKYSEDPTIDTCDRENVRFIIHDLCTN